MDRAQANVRRMAYIESEMARRHQGQNLSSNLQEIVSDTTTDTQDLNGSSNVQAQRHPAMLGKLLEEDLGSAATILNIERTKAAASRLQGDESGDSTAEGTKVRVGKDGKPWRGRKRRTSEDIRRDKLVEDVLRESKCMCALDHHPLPVYKYRAESRC
jgi:Hepatocellular carcinoma-associated antigen 59